MHERLDMIQCEKEQLLLWRSMHRAPSCVNNILTRETLQIYPVLKGDSVNPKGPLHAIVSTIIQKCELEQVMYCGFQIVSDNQKAIVALR